MSRLLLRKLGRDLRGAWSRIVLMVVAISVSLVVFSAVLYTRSITAREISTGYLSTNPASATILLDRGVDAERLSTIAAEARTRPGIIDAAPRAEFTAQIQKEGEDGWRTNPLQVFVAAAEDPLRMARFEVERGAWPPAPGEILIERGALELLGLRVGDTVVIKTPSGNQAPLRVSGVAHDPSLAPSFQEQKGYGFLSAASLPGLGEPFSLDELKIQVADQPAQPTPTRDRAVVAAAVRDLAGWLQQAHGVAVREVQVPTPYAHPHQGQLDTLLLALLIFGAASMVLSAILVATMLNGLFAQQIPQIGMMKAIGAPSGVILRLYVLMTLLVSVAATALAFAPGVLISRVWAPTILTGLLGVDAASLAAAWWTYALVIALGVTLPLLLALVPLIRASRTTVRAAIDHQGVSAQAVGATWLDRWLGRFRGLDRTLLLALRNTIRRRARLLLSVGLLAAAATLFVAGMSTMASVQTIPERARNQRHWDVEVQLAGPAPAAKVASLVDDIPGVARVEAWNVAGSAVAEPGQVALTNTYPDQAHGSMAVTAVPTGTTMLDPPPLLEGRWLRPGETGAVVLNQLTRKAAGADPRVGTTVQLLLDGRPTSWRVVGIAEEAFVSSGIYVTTEGFASATGRSGQANNLRVATNGHDPAARMAVANAVDRTLTDASIKVASSAPVDRMEEASSGHLLPIVLILLAIAVAMGVVGCIGLASTMSTNVLERTREFGVMHAIGARPVVVRRIVVAEGVVIALASCVAAVLPTLALTAIMGAGLGNLFLAMPLPFRLSTLAAGVWVLVVVIGAGAATLVPARRASRLTIREALAYL
jgi:putative ABC transport system permease protein